MSYICIIVPIHNAEEYLPEFLKSLIYQSFNDFEIIIIDDGSTDRSKKIIREQFSRAHILDGDGNYWWTKSVNKGIKYALKNMQCKYFLFMNVDLILDKNYLQSMVDTIHTSNKVMLGSAIYDINTKEKYDFGWRINWLTAGAINNVNIISNKEDIVDVSVVSGRGMFLPRNVIEEIGLLDEKLFPQYYADVAYSIEAKKIGYKLFCNTKAIIYSHINSTGITYFTKNLSIKSFWGYLTSIKSPGNLIIRWKGAIAIAPKKYVCFFLFFDTIRVIGKYFKFLLKLNRHSNY